MKDTDKENAKNNISPVKYIFLNNQLIKSMYKIINTCNSEILPYNDQVCKSRSLKFDKTLRTCWE